VKQLTLVVLFSGILMTGSGWLMGSYDYLEAVYGVM